MADGWTAWKMSCACGRTLAVYRTKRRSGWYAGCSILSDEVRTIPLESIPLQSHFVSSEYPSRKQLMEHLERELETWRMVHAL